MSASSAKSAIEKEAFFAKDCNVTSFEVGFQEVTEDYLQKLACLKAAGMITYTTETVNETRSETYGNYWTGYHTRTYEVLHVFADVKLTPEGQKLVVENPTVLREDVKKDFAPNENYEEPVPGYMSATDNSFNSADTSQEDVEVAEEVIESEEISEIGDTIVEVAEEVITPEPKNKKDPNAAYNAMLERVDTSKVNVLVGRFKIVKVKEILCTEDMLKKGEGSCTLLFKFVDKTPFGYVFNTLQENYIQSVNVKFIHYQDLGWTVDSFDK